jgi:hypothetical protein
MLFNLGELFSDLSEPKINLSIIFIALLLFFLSLFFSQSSYSESILNKKIIRRLVILIILSDILLVSFVIKNLDEFSFLGLASFMEKYRNGYYQGSGIYTFLATNIVPLLLSYFISFYKINKTVIVSMLLLCIAPLLTLGLRVFLFPIILSLLFKHFNRNKIFSKQSLFLIILIVFLTISTKLLLIPDSLSDSFGGALLNVLTRTNYQALVIPFGLKGGWASLLYGDTDKLKGLFYKQNYEYIDRLYLSGILNTSGIAIPLLPLLIILFGYFLGYIFVSILFLFIFYSVSKYNKFHRNLFSIERVFHFYFIIFVLIAFIEDFSFIYKLLYVPFLWFTIISIKLNSK